MSHWYIYLGLTLASVFLLPLIVYLCGKMWTLGVLRGGERFRQLQKKETNGEEKDAC